MASDTPDNYLDEVPDDVNKTQSEWEQLSYHARYYHVNDERKEQIREGQKRRRQEKKEWLREIKRENGCYECGETNPKCLEFHHDTGNKTANVSTMASDDSSKERIREEINKCIVLCANCHRKHH